MDEIGATQLILTATIGTLLLEASPAARARLQSAFEQLKSAALASRSSDYKLQVLDELAVAILGQMPKQD